MNWIQRFAIRTLRIDLPEPKLWVTPTEATAIRIGQWRRTSGMVEASMKLAQDATYRAQLQVLANEAPGRRISTLGTLPHDCQRILGRIEGFEACLQMLHAFTVPVLERVTEESTYEDVKEEKQT